MESQRSNELDPNLRNRLLAFVYDVYSLYDSERRGVYLEDMVKSLEGWEEGLVRRAVYALSREGLLFLATNDWLGVNYYRVGDLEGELAEQGNDRAGHALQTRKDILRRFKEASDAKPPAKLSVSEVARELNLTDVQRTAHLSILRRNNLLAGDFEYPEITEQALAFLAGAAEPLTEEAAGTIPQPAPSRRTIVFLDMISSTTRGSVWGDDVLIELQTALVSMVGRRLTSLPILERTFLGDGFMLAFDDSAHVGAKIAVDFACDLLKDVEKHNENNEASVHKQIHLRVGIHGGGVQILGDDIMGVAIAKAQRIQALTDETLGSWPGGQGSRVLVSEEILQQLRQSAAPAERPVEDAYTVRLKGLTGEHKIYRLVH